MRTQTRCLGSITRRCDAAPGPWSRPWLIHNNLSVGVFAANCDDFLLLVAVTSGGTGRLVAGGLAGEGKCLPSIMVYIKTEISTIGPTNNHRKVVKLQQLSLEHNKYVQYWHITHWIIQQFKTSHIPCLCKKCCGVAVLAGARPRPALA